ncbi:hypothetical protein PISL3812_09867 [Talaromyces islandicus]|uniref:Putative gamma-glutamylcyclotransferase n=1 Tax=Talaromyces islandicus TaxID=28573 RepID=A0A0U1MCR4_TALIS|nr:hypothetical protein PISL3812_09867 [Talaromyces islandicus]
METSMTEDIEGKEDSQSSKIFKLKDSPFIRKLRSAPPGYFYQAPNPPPMRDLFAAPTGPYFFYGTLSDPSMLRDILGLQSEPKLRPAFILGYDCKLWGQYPALVDAPGSRVKGTVYNVQTVEHGERLAAYETNNYHARPCRIHYLDKEYPPQDLGHTFMFVGNVQDLSEGEFDLKVWLKRIGRQPTIANVDARGIDK